MRRFTFLAVLPLTACPAHAPGWYGLTDEAPATTEPATTGDLTTEPASTGDLTTEPATTGTPTTGDATTGAPDPSATDSTSSELPEETSTGAPSEPPQIVSVAFAPTTMTQAGPAALILEATGDVTEVEIAADGTLLATLPFEGFAYEFEVTSQAVCFGTKTFTITVRNAEGLEDTDVADLDCELPASGSEVYTTALNGSSAAALVVLPDDKVVVAGVLDGRIALWQLDAEGSVVQSKSIADWSINPDYGVQPSYATAVARDSGGAIFVGGVIKAGATQHRYVAKLNAKFMQIWEHEGVQAEEIAGLTVAANGTAVAVGRLRTSAPNDPAAYDAGIWGYGLKGPVWSDAFARPASDPFPDLMNQWSERAHAAFALPDGSVLVLGEREYHGLDFVKYTRAYWQRYASNGERIGEPWTSPGKPFAHDAMRGGVVTKDGFALAGWGRHSLPGSLSQTLAHRFDLAGNLVASPPVLSPTGAQALGVAQDREEKLVLAGYQTQQNVWTAWVFALVSSDKPLVWEQLEPLAAANAVACGPWGRCTWVGLNAQGAVVSTRAP